MEANHNQAKSPKAGACMACLATYAREPSDNLEVPSTNALSVNLNSSECVDGAVVDLSVDVQGKMQKILNMPCCYGSEMSSAEMHCDDGAVVACHRACPSSGVCAVIASFHCGHLGAQWKMRS